jgi:glutaredoxin
MKSFIRLFFKSLRIALTPFMLVWEKLTTPKGVVRQAAAQQSVDQQCKDLALYQYRTCPFCIKVRREVTRLSLPIVMLDVQKQPQHRAALLQGGGRVKVPCLKITNAQGQVEWLYESAAINQYLHGRFA